MTFRDFVESRKIQPNEQERSFLLQVIYGLQRNNWDAALVYADSLEEQNDPSQLHTIIRLAKKMISIQTDYRKAISSQKVAAAMAAWLAQQRAEAEDVDDQFQDAARRAESFIDHPSPEWYGSHNVYRKTPDRSHISPVSSRGEVIIDDMKFYYNDRQYNKKSIPVSRVPTALLKVGLLKYLIGSYMLGKLSKTGMRTGVKPYTPPAIPKQVQQPQEEPDDPYRQ